MEKLCETCEKRDQCRTPCKAVNAILRKNNRVMERHFENIIVCYPMGKEVHFSELQKHQLDQFSNDDVIPWTSGDTRLRQTTVFVERFFNKVPCKELAERFNVKENTIVSMYARAVEQLKKIIDALDARREGLKATKADKFTDDQKFFLLVNVFGFSGAEVARMFNRDQNRMNMIIKRMSNQYLTAFQALEVKETPIEDPPMNGKLTRTDIISMVEAYNEQGLSHRQAFKRIAERYADIVRRPVSFRGIESRYYKTLAACGA